MNPLNALYGSATALRNALFDHQLLKSQRLKRPVISVGNLSVGGTGKTPFVIALGELLRARNITFDVLSRGYGRKSHGALVVQPDGSASQFGDEPLLIARQLGVPVIVGESRFKAGQIGERKFQLQLHLLDDGFQHRSLARDFDIVILSETDFTDDLLPVGRLREPLTSLQRADAVVLPASLRGAPEIDRLVKKPVICHMTRKLTLATRSEKPIVFCGIARPQQFFDQVRASGVVPAAEIRFRDHHRYTAKDANHLLALQRKTGAGTFLTTAKDAINLGQWRDSLQPLDIASLTVTLSRADDLINVILARITQPNARS